VPGYFLIDAEKTASFRSILSACPKLSSKPEIFRYDAKRAFFNEHSPAHDVACASLAWDRLAAFLMVTLG